MNRGLRHVVANDMKLRVAVRRPASMNRGLRHDQAFGVPTGLFGQKTRLDE